jgi:membrane associated rhomboid family serine protease
VDRVIPGAEAEERIALRDGQAVELHATGFSLVLGGRRTFTPYGELIHIAASGRGLRLGTERGSLLLPRSVFPDRDAPHELSRRLQERLLALPDGEQRQQRQQALDRRQRSLARPRLGLVLAVLCIAFYGLALALPSVALEGEYWRALGLTREPWRLVTSQLLHEGAAHLALNALGLLVLGGWLERQIGAARTGLVAVAAGVGAMLGCALAGYERVVGASGLVMGFAGALIALELRRPDLLPALLRLPRGLLVGAVFADFVLLSFVPNVAHGAHAGGIVAGGFAALAVAPPDAAHFRTGPLLRGACAAALLLVVAALGSFGYGLLDPGAAAARRGARLLEEGPAPIGMLNNEAWLIATSGDPSEEELELALRLARRAVRATQRQEPNLLDTLAEVYFQLGRGEDAVETIDQAIALDPDEAYYREQRRRFLGERAADDRPAPPEEPAPAPQEPEQEQEPLELEPAPDSPAIRV